MWVEVMSEVTARKAIVMAKPPRVVTAFSSLRLVCFKLIQKKSFEAAIVLMIFLNVVVLATDVADHLKSEWHRHTL